MNNILESIVQNKKKELKMFNSNGKLFLKIFNKKNANIIGEIKIASPSFDYRNRININKIYRYYGEKKDIKGISILIDEKFFAGDITRIKFLKNYKKPILFKEFVIDKKQIDGACYFGYDGLLLIKRILTGKKLNELFEYTIKKGIFPIIEIDNERDLIDVLKIKGNNFGIALNSRNLGTMKIDTNFHFDMYGKYKKEFDKKIIFAFSGVSDLNKINNYKGKFNGVLIGTSFIKKINKIYE